MTIFKGIYEITLFFKRLESDLKKKQSNVFFLIAGGRHKKCKLLIQFFNFQSKRFANHFCTHTHTQSQAHKVLFFLNWKIMTSNDQKL
jgi:hypothetical protein